MTTNIHSDTTLGSVRRIPGPRGTRIAIGEFYLVMAGINIGLVVGDSEVYRHFADGSVFAFVRNGWTGIVMTAPGMWIGVLAAGEILIGIALVAGGRWTLLGYSAIVMFHLALVLFGWGILTWSAPVLVLMSLVIRRELSTRRGTKDPAIP
jgi:hypothetical protein